MGSALETGPAPVGNQRQVLFIVGSLKGKSHPWGVGETIETGQAHWGELSSRSHLTVVSKIRLHPPGGLGDKFHPPPGSRDRACHCK